MRMQPNAMRQLTKATGRTFDQLLESGEPADKFQAMAFIELKRRHPDMDVADLWTLAGEVEIELGAETVDPTGNGRPTTWPPSAVTGA